MGCVRPRRRRMGPGALQGGESAVVRRLPGTLSLGRLDQLRTWAEVNGRDFLRVARWLAGSGGEAERRSAVSRAYYAAFHASRDLFKRLGFIVPRADRAHEYLYRRLNNCGLGPVVDAGRTLHSLRSL